MNRSPRTRFGINQRGLAAPRSCASRTKAASTIISKSAWWTVYVELADSFGVVVGRLETLVQSSRHWNGQRQPDPEQRTETQFRYRATKRGGRLSASFVVTGRVMQASSGCSVVARFRLRPIGLLLFATQWAMLAGAVVMLVESFVSETFAKGALLFGESLLAGALFGWVLRYTYRYRVEMEAALLDALRR